MDKEWMHSVQDRKVNAPAALKELRDIARSYKSPVATAE